VPLEIQLVGTVKRWKFEDGPIRVGRDSHCEVELAAEEYPTVSREHLTIQLEDGTVRVRDLKSSNGTFVNGKSITESVLNSGDTIRVGPDGPELRIQISPSVGVPTLKTPPAAVPTLKAAVHNSSQEERPTIPSSLLSATPTEPSGLDATMKTRPQEVIGDTMSASPDAAQRRARFAGVEAPQEGARQQVEAERDHSRSDSRPAAGRLLTPGEEAMIERRLSTLRNLIGFTLILVLVLLGVMIFQAQQISDNRQQLQRMQQQAKSAVDQFMPQLDQRLNGFETRMDGLDVKFQGAEDHFIERMDKEMPLMLDRYVATRVKTWEHKAATSISRP